jgi:hypothetical protein
VRELVATDKSPLPSGERARVRGISFCCLAFERGQNDGQHAFRIAQHVRIPEAQDTIALPSKGSVAPPIALACIVLTSINLDDHALFLAKKIDNPGPDRHLTAKFPPSKASISQLIPQPAFGDGRVTPQFARFKVPVCFIPPHPDPLPRGERESAPV